MIRHRLSIVFVIALTCFLLPVLLLGEDEPTEEEIGPVQILQSDSEALREIFGDIDSVFCDTITVGRSLKTQLEDRLERQVRDSVYVLYDVFRDGDYMGMAVIADERGKYRPITFMAGIGPKLRVVDVRVLVYRESRGGEVQRTRFLKQYRDKNLDDPIRINRDIINITGATISVHALNAGVRKALAVAEHIMSAREQRTSGP